MHPRIAKFPNTPCNPTPMPLPRLPILIATGNAHKVDEFRALLGLDYHLQSLRDHPHLPSPEETGTTFLENATLKALSASHLLGDTHLVLADDSGLEVDALHGAPGVYSARYSGPHATDATNRAKLLEELKHLDARGPARTARFRCELVLAHHGHILSTHTGTVEGILANQEKGTHGFGYDSLFIPDGHCQTFAQLPESIKNTLSHRARATASLVAWASRP